MGLRWASQPIQIGSGAAWLVEKVEATKNGVIEVEGDLYLVRTLGRVLGSIRDGRRLGPSFRR